jgi:MoxR-like ATPase
MITKALASRSNGHGTTLDLWNRWSALLLVRAALRRRPDHSEILPEAARKLFKAQMRPAKGALKIPAGNGVLADIDDEIARVRAELGEAEPSSIDELARRLHLKPEERSVVGFLFAAATSPFFSALRAQLNLEGLDRQGITVGFLIEALFPDSSRVVELRRIFHPSAPLVSNRIVQLESNRYALEEPDLQEIDITLSARVVNSLLGDESSYVLLSAFLEADVPDIRMDDLILPAGLKERVSEVAAAWLDRRDRSGVQEPLSFLFYGPPGTGKTLLAQALAAKHRLPLVRMRGLGASPGRNRWDDNYWSTEDIVRFVLREAHALGGIALFDECDDIFTKDSAESRSLLLEMERHKGIAILATNSPERLDRALDRRMSLRIPFSIPGRDERRRIWEVHLAREAALAGPVDAVDLANRYVFAGGYIRNAVRLASLRAGEGRPIGQAELLAAADEQAVHFSEDIANRIVAGAPLPECSTESRTALEGVARVAADALAKGDTLRVCLRGRSMGDLRQAAAGVAWKLQLGTLFCPLSALQGDQPKGGKENGVNESAVYTLMAALPSDCALAIEDADGSEGLEPLWELSRARPGIYFHLDGGRRRKSRPGALHFTVQLDAPEAAVRAAIWTKALAKEGVACEEALARELAELRPLGSMQIAELARLSRWKSLLRGAPQIERADILAAIQEFTRGAGSPPLFGI